MAPGPSPHRLTSAKVTRGKGARPRGRARRTCACAPMRTCVCSDVCVRGRTRTCCARAHARIARGTAAALAAGGWLQVVGARSSSPSALQLRVGSALRGERGVEDPGQVSFPLATLSSGFWVGAGSWPHPLPFPPTPPLTFAVPETLIKKVLSPPPQIIGPEVCFVPFVIRPR